MAKPGADDQFSDIDVRWAIPPEQVVAQLQSLRTTLQRVGAVESLRMDPEPRLDWRLVFVRFEGWPLWWRVDLEIHSPGIGSAGVPGVDEWSPYESACLGVVVTWRARARHPPEGGERLWSGARERAAAVDVTGDGGGRIGAPLEPLATNGPGPAAFWNRAR